MMILIRTLFLSILSMHGIFAMETSIPEVFPITQKHPCLKILKKIDPVDVFILQQNITFKPHVDHERRTALVDIMLEEHCLTQFNFYLSIINGKENERIPLATFCDLFGKLIGQRYVCRDCQEEASKMVENLANVVIQDMKIWYERGKFFKHHGLIEADWKEKPLSYDDLIVKRNFLQSRCYLWVKICRDLSSTQNSYHSDYTNRFLPPLVEEKESMPNAENNPEYRKKLSLMACDTLIFCRDITQQITPVLVMLHEKDTSCLKSLNALIEHYDTMALLSLDETKSGFDMLNTAYKKVADEIIIEQPESKSDSESAPTSDLPTINKTESKKKKRMSGSLPYFFKDNSK